MNTATKLRDMTILYQVGNSLYLNITNRCSCACVFCIRTEYTGVGDGENLWLEHEPSAAEVITCLEGRDLTRYDEAVFCGYGEPTESLETLLETARYLKARSPELVIRLNTNGLADLLYGKSTAPLLEGFVDKVSISLNAPDAVRYQAVTRPSLGEGSFQAMLDFAAGCKESVPWVAFTVVDVISREEIDACQTIADSMGIPLRVRHKT